MKSKKHILVVDDVTTNLKCLGEILRGQYSISMAKSGEQAIQMAEKVRPDLVLLDIKMPGMNGFETMIKMHENPKCGDIPVIFLTADKDNDNEIKGLKLGARDFIRKPYEPEVMLSRIETVLAQEERNKSIEQLAYKDSLTGLWNRHYLVNQIEIALCDKQTGSLMIFDLDNFKGINDRYGHVVGDAALVAFANTLSSFVHKDDVVARIGGDEFVVFLRNSYGKELLTSRMEDLVLKVEKELSIIKKDESISSVSIGISALPFDGKSFSELYNNADKALYYVKRNGKSGFHFYDSNDDYSFTDNNEIAMDISAIREKIDKTEKFEGPLTVSNANFSPVYELLKRNALRNGCNTQVVLFSLKNLDMNSENDNIEKSMDALEKAIFFSLRKNDVATKFTDSQYLVVLVDADDSSREGIVSRVFENWSIYNADTNVLLKYEIEKIIADGEKQWT